MKKRRILLALIMLIISGISLTTATYAWFTANQDVSVEQIDIQATSSGGIQISADAENWSNVVSLSDLRAVNEKTDLGINNYIPDIATNKSLKPVTTIGVNGTTGQFDFFLGELNQAGDNVKLTAESESTGNLVAFDLYFYSATEQTVYFDGGTGVTAKDDADDAKLKSSMRVGFLFQGNEASNPATARSNKKGTVDDQVIWEPNATTHTQYAIDQLGAEDGKATETMGGKQATGTSYVDTTSETYFTKITSDLGLVTSTIDEVYPSTLSWNLAAGINKFRVYIWIEGQDIDCEDTASLGAGITAKLAFTINTGA